MNRQPDVELVLHDYFADDGLTAPDYVLDVIERRISRQPQRRAWPFAGRTTMNNQIKLVVGLAAALAVAVVGYNLLPRTGGIGSTPTPSPTAATVPLATPAAILVPALPDGPLDAGTYRLAPLGSAPNLRIDATVPAGWQGFGSWAILGPKGTGAPQGAGIGFIAADGIYSDPCHWDIAGDHSWPQKGDIKIGPTVVDLANGLVANRAYQSTTPADTVLGGYAGKKLDLQLPSDFGACDKDRDGVSRYMVFGGIDAGLYAQGPAWRMQVTIVDAAGTRLIAVLGDYAATPGADRTAAQAILDSLVIRP